MYALPRSCKDDSVHGTNTVFDPFYLLNVNWAGLYSRSFGIAICMIIGFNLLRIRILMDSMQYVFNCHIRTYNVLVILNCSQ